ncbi:hypothetical protein, partial [Actinomadura sp. CNU-125]|uniref:hypothetical protein n=1 Tax=Actinomadura sp. CNU-125 TaxID=1904961 RepID=UPI0039672ECF
MNTRRPGRRGRSIWGRIAGYGVAVLLVAAPPRSRVPLLEKDGGAGAAGARTPAAGATAPSNAPHPAHRAAHGPPDARPDRAGGRRCAGRRAGT